MSGSIPRVLIPLVITDGMFISSTIAEPASGETAWVSAGTYAVGDRRIRATTHRIYECSTAHTGITTVPELDPTRWFEIGPTMKWAGFDTACSTQSLFSTTLTMVLQPGFFNAVALYKLLGSVVSVSVKDAPGGTVIYSYSGSIDGPYSDEYDWCWGPYRQRQKLVLSGIEVYPLAELTISITTNSGTAGVGMVAIGDLKPIIVENWGGTEYGATAEPVDYSYIKTNEFGDTTIVKRRNATDMKISVIMPAESADYALSCVQEVLAVPAAWIATDESGYEGLNVFGLGSGSLSYESFSTSKLNISVKGMV